MGYILVIVLLLLLGQLGYKLLYIPWRHSENNQRSDVAGQVAAMLASGVLHRGFDYSHLFEGERRAVGLVRFLEPVGRRVALAKGNQGNDHEDSFLYVWSWARWRPEPVPIASIYLELDLEHLPYEGTVDWLVQNREAIEVQAGAMLMVSGVTRVKMQYRELRDREQQRVIFRIVYREREKGPAIPHHLDYGQMIAAWGQAAQERQKYNGVEIMERERLALDILNYAIAYCGGTFPLKRLQAAFAAEVSHRQIESLGQRLEQAGILGEIRGNKPRLINLAAAAAYLEKHKAPPMQMFAANT